MAWWIGGSTWSGTNTAPTSDQRADEVVAPLHRAHEHADGDGEQRGQDPAEHEHGPPGHGQGAVGPRQDPEELPLVASAEACDHRCSPPSASIRFLASSDPATTRQKACKIDLSIRGWAFSKWGGRPRPLFPRPDPPGFMPWYGPEIPEDSITRPR